ncbi:MAG TPA: hemerythrin domain-containing protein [Burkholderiales bacterium]|nr:hemerythrin domain-containing protein [Burkholderiales bacterium]
MNDFFLAPAPSFNEPIEMLEACHERIRTYCSILEKLVAHLEFFGSDDEARQAAGRVMHYFDTSGRDHHADEEVNLFPMLAETEKRLDIRITLEIDLLMKDHRDLDRLWMEMRDKLQKISEGKGMILKPAEVSRLCGKYDHHLIQEESRIFPFARKYLSEEQLRELGAAMVARRIMD